MTNGPKSWEKEVCIILSGIMKTWTLSKPWSPETMQVECYWSISFTYWKSSFIGTISRKIIRTIKYFLIFRFFSFFLESRPDLKRNTQILLTLCIAFQLSFFIRTTNHLFVHENHKYTISWYDGWSWFQIRRFFSIEQHLWIFIFYVQKHIPPSVIEWLNTF